MKKPPPASLAVKETTPSDADEATKILRARFTPSHVELLISEHGVGVTLSKGNTAMSSGVIVYPSPLILTRNPRPQTRDPKP
jgi:hypothetical protein